MKKKSNNQQQNNSKPTQMLGHLYKIVNTNKGAILGALIAIGAYSKDSLFFQLFFHDKKFGVSVNTCIVAPLNQCLGYVLNSDTANSPKLMTGINLIMYLNIKNNTNQIQYLQGIDIECKGPNGEWIHLPLKKMTPPEKFYFPMDKDSATLISFEDENLLDILVKNPSLNPNTVLNGYLMTESFIYSKNYKELQYPAQEFRISFYTEFDKEEIQEFSYNEQKKNFFQFKQILWQPEKEKVYLKKYILTPESNFSPSL